MKRLLLVILVLTPVFSLVVEAMAASKPPAKLCLDMTPVLDSYMAIATKSVTSVTMANGPTPVYSVNGTVFAIPSVP